MSNMNGVTCCTGSATHSGAIMVIRGFDGVYASLLLVFYVVFCVLLFVCSLFVFCHGTVSCFRPMSLNVPLVSVTFL